MRFIIHGGNMQGNNLMQIRVLAKTAPGSVTQLQDTPRLIHASYVAPLAEGGGEQAGSAPESSIASLLGLRSSDETDVSHLQVLGLIGYSQGGQGAQALIPVPISAPPPCNNPEIVTSYDPNDTGLFSGYHHYVVETTICLIESAGCTTDAVFARMLSSSNFAAPTQDSSPMYECKKTNVQIPVLGSGTIQTTIDPQKRQIINYTLADHPLKNGEVIRTVISDPGAGRVYIRTEGFGDGVMPYLNETNAPGIWSGVDQRLKESMTPSQVKPVRRSGSGKH